MVSPTRGDSGMLAATDRPLKNQDIFLPLDFYSEEVCVCLSLI